MQPPDRLSARDESQDPTRTALMLGALATALVSLAVLRPPEMYPWAGAACRAVLVASAGLLWRRAHGRPLLPRFTDGLVPLAIGAVALASCRARAFDETFEALTLVLTALLGTAVARDRGSRGVIAGVV